MREGFLLLRISSNARMRDGGNAVFIQDSMVRLFQWKTFYAVLWDLIWQSLKLLQEKEFWKYFLLRLPETTFIYRRGPSEGEKGERERQKIRQRIA